MDGDKPSIFEIDFLDPLFRKIQERQYDSVEELLRSGEDVNKVLKFDFAGENVDLNPLVLSIYTIDLKMMKILLQYWADVKDKRRFILDDWASPLIHVVNCNADFETKKEMFALLEESGVSIRVLNDGDVLPLQIALLKNDTNLFSFLMEKEANINSYDRTGFTALGNICLMEEILPTEREELVKILLENGADPNLPNGMSYETSLHLCNQSITHSETYRDLIKYGADPYIKNGQRRNFFEDLNSRIFVCNHNIGAFVLEEYQKNKRWFPKKKKFWLF